MTMEFILRLLVAGVMGTVIGLDREYRAKEAGFRTHFLVSLGSALIMIVSQHGFYDILGAPGVGLDPSRIAAQVVTGIGFIGAGTIILNKQIVRGLTTAAGIWATSGIGLAVGAGMYALGISATLLTLVGLEALNMLFRRVGMRTSFVEFSTADKDVVAALSRRFNSKEFLVVSYRMKEVMVHDTPLYNVTMVIKSKGNGDTVMAQLNEFEDITILRVE